MCLDRRDVWGIGGRVTVKPFMRRQAIHLPPSLLPGGSFNITVNRHTRYPKDGATKLLS
jgi:hypothetical protein